MKVAIIKKAIRFVVPVVKDILVDKLFEKGIELLKVWKRNHRKQKKNSEPKKKKAEKENPVGKRGNEVLR